MNESILLGTFGVQSAYAGRDLFYSEGTFEIEGVGLVQPLLVLNAALSDVEFAWASNETMAWAQSYASGVEPPSRDQYCSHCGARFRTGGKFCVQCGAPNGVAHSPTSANPSASAVRQEGGPGRVLAGVISPLWSLLGSVVVLWASSSLPFILSSEIDEGGALSFMQVGQSALVFVPLIVMSACAAWAQFRRKFWTAWVAGAAAVVGFSGVVIPLILLAPLMPQDRLDGGDMRFGVAPWVMLAGFAVSTGIMFLSTRRNTPGMPTSTQGSRLTEQEHTEVQPIVAAPSQVRTGTSRYIVITAVVVVAVVGLITLTGAKSACLDHQAEIIVGALYAGLAGTDPSVNLDGVRCPLPVFGPEYVFPSATDMASDVDIACPLHGALQDDATGEERLQDAEAQFFTGGIPSTGGRSSVSP